MSKHAFQQALDDAADGRHDEVTLSYAASRGVEGMQPREVQAALQSAVTSKVQELQAKAEATLAESKGRFPVGSRVEARWAGLPLSLTDDHSSHSYFDSYFSVRGALSLPCTAQHGSRLSLRHPLETPSLTISALSHQCRLHISIPSVCPRERDVLAAFDLVREQWHDCPRFAFSPDKLISMRFL